MTTGVGEAHGDRSAYISGCTSDNGGFAGKRSIVSRR
jgi:hypothetical protein